MLNSLYSIPALCAMFVFLLVYSLAIVLLFRTDKQGRRRRWVALDYVWVPLGGLTGVCLLVAWFHLH